MLKIVKYVDCDGVILDTETRLFDEYNRLKNSGINISRTTYLQQMDWREWLRQAQIVNNSVTILNEHDSDGVFILTKVHSLQEGSAKVEYFRELKIKNGIILVPYNLSKSSVVAADNTLLVDDSLKNLDDWATNNGISLFFNQSGKNECTFDDQITMNKHYPIVSSLDSIFSKEMEDYCKRLILKK